jgi:hypothetical protein
LAGKRNSTQADNGVRENKHCTRYGRKETNGSGLYGEKGYEIYPGIPLDRSRVIGGDGGLDGRWRGWTCQIKTAGKGAGIGIPALRKGRRGASLEAGHHLVSFEVVGHGGPAYGLDSPHGFSGQVAYQELQLRGSDSGAAYVAEAGGRVVRFAGRQWGTVLERVASKERPFLSPYESLSNIFWAP